MEFSFLFWLFFVGLIVASLQDLKRREVDDWLNFFLIFSSFIFIFFNFLINNSIEIIFQAGFLIILFFFLANLFYELHVFAGGDAKLLFSLGLFFISSSFLTSIFNVGYFIFLLLISGSLWGISYLGFIYAKDFRKINKEFGKQIASFKFSYFFLAGLFLFIIGFYNSLFLLFGLLVLLYPLLFIFASSIEKASMHRSVLPKNLVEGDWLVKDIKINKQIIRSSFEGLSSHEITLLKKKGRSVLIKDGIPFVPSFLIAFLIFVFSKGFAQGILGFLF